MRRYWLGLWSCICFGLFIASVVTFIYAQNTVNTSSTASYNGPARGTTGSIGGGALLAGACSTGTVSITGATIGSPVEVSAADGTNLASLGAYIHGDVTSSGVVTVSVCAIIALTPPSKTYNVAIP